MNGKLILDTNAVIAYRAGNKSVRSLIEVADTLFLTVIVLGELILGAMNSLNPTSNQEAIKKFLKHTTVIAIDEPIALHYSKIRTTLKRNGTPIPENDVWIAAILYPDTNS